ncbi:MAG TPA: alpha/beta hydrolase [Ktedonobacterales bacterium]
MKTKVTVKNGGVTLPVTLQGDGQQIIFVNGGGATQYSWKGVLQHLRGSYQTVTFDVRGHGKASAAKDYSFEAFLSDVETVIGRVARGKPIVVGWSFGADLAVMYAARHPSAVAGVVVVDGAVPIAETLTEDEVKMREAINRPAMKLSMALMRLTPYGYALTGDMLADLVMDLNIRRQRLLEVYATLDCPITLLIALKSIGINGAHAERGNRIWREGAERLHVAHPEMGLRWVDDGHKFPLNHPESVSQVVDAFAQQLSAQPVRS